MNPTHTATIEAMSKSLDELLLAEPTTEAERSERREAVAALRAAIKSLKFIR